MRVLIATDGNAPAVQAQQLLERIGNRDELDITVMVVPVTVPAVVEHAPLPPEWEIEQVLHAHKLAKRTVAELDRAGFRADSCVRRGAPATEILRVIEEEEVGLTVMGAGHSSWLGNLILGSVSTRILHDSPSSVLVVHTLLQQPTDRARVLLGTDGSGYSIGAARLVTEVADPARCLVTIVSVAPRPPTLNLAPMAIMRPAVARNDRFQEELIERARHHTTGAKHLVADAGFDVHTAITVGHPTSALLKEAENLGCDLLAVGSRGLGPVRRSLLGSVSDNVARHAAATLVSRNREAP
jgi:nucleotide-binding universal stress UspA family protein